jgi:hypothetical protein
MKLTKVTKLVIAVVLSLGIVAANNTTASAESVGDYWLGTVDNGEYGCWQIIEIIPFPGGEIWRNIRAPMEMCVPPASNVSSVRGTAFMDNNADGKRDAGEHVFGEAWFKLTDGGSWFVCGTVGGDATFGVTVNPGTYYVLPVAPKGYKTTTPRVKAEVKDGTPALNVDIGFVADPAATGEACDQYNPPRP